MSNIDFGQLFDVPERVLPVSPELRIKEQLVGFHAMNGSLPENSASRMYMFSSHFSQILSILYGDPSIWQTGLERQFGKNTFNCKAPADCTVLRVVSRYGNYSTYRDTDVTELVIMVMRHDTKEIDCIEIPYYHTLHQYFGFKYNRNKDVLADLGRGTILKKDTVLADAPTVGENGEYAPGINAEIALMPLPEGAEDGVVISDDLGDQFCYDVFEKRTMQYGANKIPINKYGDENEYKPFPEIGEKIGDDSVLMALRTFEPGLAPALFTKKALMEYDPTFDELFCVRGPGETELMHGRVMDTGVVVDIQAYHSPQYKKDVFTGTGDIVKKYIDGYTKFNEDLINAHNDIQSEYRSLYGNEEIRTSEQLTNKLVKAYAIANPDKNKISFCFKKDPVDIVRVEITVKYTMRCKIGNKLSDLAG